MREPDVGDKRNNIGARYIPIATSIALLNRHCVVIVIPKVKCSANVGVAPLATVRTI